MIHISRRQFLSSMAATAAPFVILHRRADANPAEIGAWSPRVPLPTIAIHMTALPGTTLSLMAFARVGLGTKAWLYDWGSKLITDCSVPYVYDWMCGGHILDDAGRFRVYGGRDNAFQTATFDARTRTWTRGPDLSGQIHAYYPSVVRTGAIPGYPGGAVLIAYGRRTFIDIYDQHSYGATAIQRMPATANLTLTDSLYPRLHVLPDGGVFLGGTDRLMRRLDVPSARWTTIGEMLWGRRYDGSSTPLPGSGYEFLLSGGDVAAVANRMEIVNARTGTRRETAATKFSRRQHNTVLLPDGTVLLLGGTGTPAPYAPELYDPVSERCRLMAATLPSPSYPGDLGRPYRAYHSTADLLDDGRVVWAGGVDGSKGFSMEIFSPPYLFRGPRPVISITPGLEQIAYGGLATFTSPDTSLVARMVLMRPGPVSHGYNGEQRHIECPFIVTDVVQAAMPTSPNVAPPGWYRAYALSAQGVPSLAQWVRIV